jgi:hypothetical protein
MTPSLLEPLDIELIEAELARKRAVLADKEEDLDSLQATIARLRASIGTLEGLLEANRQGLPDIEEPTSIQDARSHKRLHRHPMAMLHSPYKGMKLGDVAALVLSQSSQPLTTAELTRLIYDTQTEEEFERARNSLSAELRSGVRGESPRWRKIGRFAYAACSLSTVSAKK